MRLCKQLTTLAVGASLALSVSATAFAEDKEYERLEQRVNELEQMLEALKKELKAKASQNNTGQSQTLQHKRQSVVTAKPETSSGSNTVIEMTAQSPADAQQSQPSNDSAPSTATSHDYAFGGFIKTTASFSAYSDGDVPAATVGRDFYVPGTVPVGGEGESTDFDFGAKETRINFRSTHKFANGEQVKTFLEMDFLLTPGGNERVSNSYSPRLRHAWIEYRNWRFGQGWTTFQDLGALVESVDFLGASEGTAFNRQPMIRYTNGPWQFALENSETTITPFGGGARIVSDDNAYPDFIARYNHKRDWGHITIAGLFRRLEYDVVGRNESEGSFGLSLSGKYYVGERDDIRFMLVNGKGMGRYMGLNTANGAVLTNTGELRSIDSTGGYVAYRHFWTDRVRSTFSYSQLDIDNEAEFTGLNVTKSSRSAQINLLYSPVEKITLGLGFLHANRTIESRIDGELNRLIFTARYDF